MLMCIFFFGCHTTPQMPLRFIHIKHLTCLFRKCQIDVLHLLPDWKWLPGETIEIKGGEVYIDGQMLQEDYLPGEAISGEMDAVTVPEGQLFVMGDNRECSEDSRSPRVGTIEQSTIVGKVIVRLYPFNSIKTFKGVDYES